MRVVYLGGDPRKQEGRIRENEMPWYDCVMGTAVEDKEGVVTEVPLGPLENIGCLLG